MLVYWKTTLAFFLFVHVFHKVGVDFGWKPKRQTHFAVCWGIRFVHFSLLIKKQICLQKPIVFTHFTWHYFDTIIPWLYDSIFAPRCQGVGLIFPICLNPRLSCFTDKRVRLIFPSPYFSKPYKKRKATMPSFLFLSYPYTSCFYFFF